jgi:DNA polymerase alpha subunit A
LYCASQEERSYKIFDKVTEEEYRAIVKGRLEEDDFIEDDDGSGYVDNGLEEDWNRRNTDSEDGSDSDAGKWSQADTGSMARVRWRVLLLFGRKKHTARLCRHDLTCFV